MAQMYEIMINIRANTAWIPVYTGSSWVAKKEYICCLDLLMLDSIFGQLSITLQLENISCASEDAFVMYCVLG